MWDLGSPDQAGYRDEFQKGSWAPGGRPGVFCRWRCCTYMPTLHEVGEGLGLLAVEGHLLCLSSSDKPLLPTAW